MVNGKCFNLIYSIRGKLPLPYVTTQFNFILFWLDIFLPHVFSLRSTVRPVVSNKTRTILRIWTKVFDPFSTETCLCAHTQTFAGNFGRFTGLFKTNCELLKNPENPVRNSWTRRSDSPLLWEKLPFPIHLLFNEIFHVNKKFSLIAL